MAILRKKPTPFLITLEILRFVFEFEFVFTSVFYYTVKLRLLAASLISIGKHVSGSMISIHPSLCLFGVGFGLNGCEE